MIQKNFIFILTSVILAFLISYYYIKKMDKQFLILFVIVFIIFFTLFYFLGNKIEKKVFENFEQEEYEIVEEYEEDEEEYYDKYNTIMVEEEYEEDEEEDTHNKSTINKSIIHQEEHNTVPHQEHHEEQHHPMSEEHHSVHQEEMNKYVILPPPPPQVTPMLTKKQKIKSKPKAPKPTPKPVEKKPHDKKKTIDTPYGPLNINISYNSQNSINEIENGISSNKHKKFNTNIDKENKLKKNKNEETNKGKLNDKNLGLYKINNNKDWIYGNKAFTKNPEKPYTGVQSEDYIPKKNNLKNAVSYNDDKSIYPYTINNQSDQLANSNFNPLPYNL